MIELKGCSRVKPKLLAMVNQKCWRVAIAIAKGCRWSEIISICLAYGMLFFIYSSELDVGHIACFNELI
jgi:hypothetical protein